jgi:L-threonylcarbamoyladenylate synthase
MDSKRRMTGLDLHQSAQAVPIMLADAAGIAAAAEVLRQGGIVALPTETVYGLAADATSDAAVARIYAAKDRPDFNPLIVHMLGLKAARAQGIFSAQALQLAQAFWPGPLTLVVPLAASASICAPARAGQPTVALRVPAHPIALAVLSAAGTPLAAPSANRSGRVSPVTALHVARDLGEKVDLILDGGRCPVGVESTIISCVEAPRLLRPGGILREKIESLLGAALEAPGGVGSPLAPGMLKSHYAPQARLRLQAKDLKRGEAGLDFGGVFGGASNVLNLSPRRDLAEAAANLFIFLRALDAQNPAAIAVAPIPEEGLGEAINDRLRRAAAPRPYAGG